MKDYRCAIHVDIPYILIVMDSQSAKVSIKMVVSYGSLPMRKDGNWVHHGIRDRIRAQEKMIGKWFDEEGNLPIAMDWERKSVALHLKKSTNTELNHPEIP